MSSPISIIRADGAVWTFDGVITYSLNSSVTVTDHPVEDGSVVSDHANKQPKVLGIRGIVTETPYRSQSSIGGPDHVSAALAFLDSIAGDVATVVTERFGTMTSMAITRYPTTADKVLRLEFDVEFKQIRIAVAQFVEISPEQVAVTASISDAANDILLANDVITVAALTASAGLPDAVSTGEQATDPAEDDDAQDADDSSLLLDLTEATGTAP